MRFLVDNALSSELVRLLNIAGHDAVHVRDYEMHAAEDKDILERAGAEDRILVSADSDFSMVLANSRHTKPSFVLFREPNIIRPAEYASHSPELAGYPDGASGGLRCYLSPRPNPCTHVANSRSAHLIRRLCRRRERLL